MMNVNHTCSIYQHKLQLEYAIAEFFDPKNTGKQKCVCVTSQPLELNNKDVQILSANEVYLKDGKFDIEATIQNFVQLIKQALKDGYTGLRASGDATWAIDENIDLDRLVEYETKAHKAITENPVAAICHYNEKKFKPEFLKKILISHPQIYIYGQRYDNKFFGTDVSKY